jgi:hypothetical protein
MNPKELYQKLNDNLSGIELSSIYYSDKSISGYDYIFRNLNSFRKAYRYLNSYGILPITDSVKEKFGPILSTDNDVVGMDFSFGNPIDIAGQILINSVQSLLNLLKNKVLTEPDESVDELNVKLVKVDDLEELEKTASLLKKAFSLPVLEVDGKVNIQSIENGSVWIALGIIGATGVALKLCANLIWSAAVIYRKYQEAKTAEQHMRTIKLKNDFMEGVMKQQLEYIEESKNTEAQAIAQQFYPDGNGETQNRIKLAIDSIGTLLEKGAEFYPSINASTEEKALFPDFNVLHLIESKSTKLLDEGKADSKDQKE